MVNYIVKKTKLIQLVGFLLMNITLIGIIQGFLIMDSKSSAGLSELLYLIFWVLIGIAAYGMLTLSVASLKRAAMVILVSVVLDLIFAGLVLKNNLHKYELMVSASTNGVFESQKFKIVYQDFVWYMLIAALLMIIYLICIRRSKLAELESK